MGDCSRELIFDIEKFVNDFSLKGVKLFVPKTYDLYSLAAASALSAYLNTVCGITTTLVANQEKVEETSLCLPVTEDPSTIQKNANDFLAILLDCETVNACENQAFRNTFCVFQARGTVSMKSFGVEGYNDSDALCAAEVIFNSIQAHSDIYRVFCQEAYDYLYLAMLDATSVLKLHMKTKTFETIQALIESGAEVDIKPECFRKKNSDEIKILEKIYTDFHLEDEIGYMIFDDEKWQKIKSSCYSSVLEYIRFIKPFSCWAAFVKSNYGYTVYLQGNATGKFDLTKAMKNYAGISGTRKKAKCRIKQDEIEKTLDDLKEMLKKAHKKEKPRKPYTHKPGYKKKSER